MRGQCLDRGGFCWGGRGWGWDLGGRGCEGVEGGGEWVNLLVGEKLLRFLLVAFLTRVEVCACICTLFMLPGPTRLITRAI